MSWINLLNNFNFYYIRDNYIQVEAMDIDRMQDSLWNKISILLVYIDFSNKINQF